MSRVWLTCCYWRKLKTTRQASTRMHRRVKKRHSYFHTKPSHMLSWVGDISLLGLAARIEAKNWTCVFNTTPFGEKRRTRTRHTHTLCAYVFLVSRLVARCYTIPKRDAVERTIHTPAFLRSPSLASQIAVQPVSVQVSCLALSSENLFIYLHCA